MSVIVSADAGGQVDLRSEECNEQDFRVTLDRVPDVRLHVGGHGCDNVTDTRREQLEDSVVSNRELRGHTPAIA